VIYYHFKNKEDILQQMFRRFAESVLSYKTQMGSQFFSGEASIREMTDQVVDLLYMEPVQRLSKILMMEAIKGNDRELLFDLWESNIRVLYDHFSNLLNPMMRESSGQLQFETFFFGMMPVLSFSVFRKQWGQRYDKTQDDLKEMFADTLAAYFEQVIKHRIWNIEAVEQKQKQNPRGSEV
jgi:AcrR family transcriptional regulator